MNEEARQATAYDANHPNKAFHVDGTRIKCNKADITCYKCQKKGHYRNECPELKEEEKAAAVLAGLADSNDEEDTLW